MQMELHLDNDQGNTTTRTLHQQPPHLKTTKPSSTQLLHHHLKSHPGQPRTYQLTRHNNPTRSHPRSNQFLPLQHKQSPDHSLSQEKGRTT